LSTSVLTVRFAGERTGLKLAALDQGELVTIPALPDIADWQNFDQARKALGPNLSHKHAAARYGVHA
jgi:hypothetical protein